MDLSNVTPYRKPRSDLFQPKPSTRKKLNNSSQPRNINWTLRYEVCLYIQSNPCVRICDLLQKYQEHFTRDQLAHIRKNYEKLLSSVARTGQLPTSKILSSKRDANSSLIRN